MYIGLDIGFTKINSVLMKGDRIILKRKVATKSLSNRKIIIAQIFDCINYLIRDVNKKQIKGIGIGVPGPVDFKKQRIFNITAFKNIALAKIVQRQFKIKAKVDNDVNCFGLAESILGAGKGVEVLIGLTLGTGLGGAIVINGEIFRGISGSAGEFGPMIIDKNGRKPGRKSDGGRLQNRGGLENHVSAKGIVKTAKEIGCKGVNVKEIGHMANSGNKKAIKVFQITGEYLGIGLANIVNILNPSIIVIGGGIADNNKFIFSPARKIMKKLIISPLAKNTKVNKAKFGEDSGAIGAALLFYP